MKNRERTSRKLHDLVPIVLLGLFALCILAVLLMGADVYGDMVRRDRQNFAHRTCAGYLSTRLRQARSTEAVTISSEAKQQTNRSNITKRITELGLDLEESTKPVKVIEK